MAKPLERTLDLFIFFQPLAGELGEIRLALSPLSQLVRARLLQLLDFLLDGSPLLFVGL
jgi:hypothetical protein